MDILAHGLWAGIGVTLIRRRHRVSRRTAAVAIAMAVVPDLVQLIPFLTGALFAKDGVSVLHAYVMALPGFEPVLPPIVALLTHHLHCIMHSAIIAAVVAFVVAPTTWSSWLPLLGWWSHIVIDVFTHSNDFYPVPVLYPFTQNGFDGLAWNTPWFLVVNYVTIVAGMLYLAGTRRKWGQDR